MTDELLRPFRDKLRGRPPAPRATEDPPAPAEDDTPADSIVIRDVRVGPFPEAASLHPGFLPGVPRVRLTLDLGARLRDRPAVLHPEERVALLALCPRLAEHQCGGGDEIRRHLVEDAGGAPEDPLEGEAGDGLSVAHLIEHVAIELIVDVLGVARCSGVTCAHGGRLDRFDIFLESVDPVAGRAAAILAAAIVRDLCLRRVARLALHRRCRDLLISLSSSGAARFVAEDAAFRLGCGPDEALQALEELVRLGYLAAVPSAFLFSSNTGIVFRRTSVDPSEQQT